MPVSLLDPKNDFVFKKLFVNCPDLLVDFINAVRSDADPIEAVDILNPRIDPEELTGKFIILDVLARDSRGHCFNIEMQVRCQSEWLERSLFYLAHTCTSQLKSGDDYATLKPVIGINLLDFDLFTGDKAHWHFRLLDPEQPAVRLELLQLHILELRKLDRQRSADPLSSWITYFKHWREDTIMNEIRHPPVQKALDQLKDLSNDEETRWRALARERALHDETSFLASARRKGLEEGLLKGQEQGLAQGVLDGERQVLKRLLTRRFGALPSAVLERLEQADSDQPECWVENVLDAPSLDAVFA